jgi:hypothetical protein
MNFFGDIFFLEGASIFGKIKLEVGKKAIRQFMELVQRGQAQGSTRGALKASKARAGRAGVLQPLGCGTPCR